MRFTDKSIIVTGAGSGIGRAAALLFAREGGKVIVADKTDGADETAHADHATPAAPRSRSRSTPGSRTT